jgi:hypothetical protein
MVSDRNFVYDDIAESEGAPFTPKDSLLSDLARWLPTFTGNNRFPEGLDCIENREVIWEIKRVNESSCSNALVWRCGRDRS